MPEITLHFDADPQAGLEAVAQQLQERVRALEGVDAAQAEGYPQRGTPEIVLVLTVAATVLNSGANTLEALKRLIESARAVGAALGLHRLWLERGTRKLDPGELSHEHVIDLERGG